MRVAVWERLSDVNVAVTGGGNLFSDADLNFPLKIDAAWKRLREAGIPVAVFAVGVSDNWTGKGAELFRRAFSGTHVLDASVRDARSAEAWDRRFGHSGVPRARVVRDPGLLVSFHVVERAGEAGRPRPHPYGSPGDDGSLIHASKASTSRQISGVSVRRRD